MKGNIASWVSQFPYDKKHNTSRDNLQCLGHSVVMWKEQGVGNLVGNNSDIKTVLLLKYPAPKPAGFLKALSYVSSRALTLSPGVSGP